MAVQENQGGGSVLVPVLIIVLGLAICVALVQVQFQVRRLNKTDTIACAFINADASTRTKQANNAGKSLTAQHAFIKGTSGVLGLFDSPAAKKQRTSQTPQQRASSGLFIGYLRSQQTVSTISAANTEKNIALTQKLAAKARSLALKLNCVKPS